MAKYTLQVNGRAYQVEAEPDMPLLWVLRDLLQLTGTKYGCGIGVCGACTVHEDGLAVRSCQITIARGSIFKLLLQLRWLKYVPAQLSHAFVLIHRANPTIILWPEQEP